MLRPSRLQDCSTWTQIFRAGDKETRVNQAQTAGNGAKRGEEDIVQASGERRAIWGEDEG